MLPGFWRAIGPWLPNAAGFTLLRNTLYYGGHNFGSAIPVLGIYMVAGAALLLVFGSSRIALYTPRRHLGGRRLAARRAPAGGKSGGSGKRLIGSRSSRTELQHHDRGALLAGAPRVARPGGAAILQIKIGETVAACGAARGGVELAAWETYLEEHASQISTRCSTFCASRVSRRCPLTWATCGAPPSGGARLTAAGLEHARVMPTTGHPVVYADYLHAPGKPTILIYGHFDVQPADPFALWTTPPFEPQVRDGRVYARGASDDKGNMLAPILAIEAFCGRRALCRST